MPSEHDVTVADINLNSANETSENLIGQGKFGFEKVDVTSRASAVDLFERVLATSPRVDILVNNAGVIGARDWWSHEEPNEDDWDAVFAVNVKGIATVTDVVSQHMIANNYGKIVNIASIAARHLSAQATARPTSAGLGGTQSPADQSATTASAACAREGGRAQVSFVTTATRVSLLLSSSWRQSAKHCCLWGPV